MTQSRFDQVRAKIQGEAYRTEGEYAHTRRVILDKLYIDSMRGAFTESKHSETWKESVLLDNVISEHLRPLDTIYDAKSISPQNKNSAERLLNHLQRFIPQELAAISAELSHGHENKENVKPDVRNQRPREINTVKGLEDYIQKAIKNKNQSELLAGLKKYKSIVSPFVSPERLNNLSNWIGQIERGPLVVFQKTISKEISENFLKVAKIDKRSQLEIKKALTQELLPKNLLANQLTLTAITEKFYALNRDESKDVGSIADLEKNAFVALKKGNLEAFLDILIKYRTQVEQAYIPLPHEYLHYLSNIINKCAIALNNPSPMLQELIQKKMLYGADYPLIDPTSQYFKLMNQHKLALIQEIVSNEVMKKKAHAAEPLDLDKAANDILNSIPLFRAAVEMDMRGKILSILKTCLKQENVLFQVPINMDIDIGLLALSLPPPDISLGNQLVNTDSSAVQLEYKQEELKGTQQSPARRQDEIATTLTQADQKVFLDLFKSLALQIKDEKEVNDPFVIHAFREWNNHNEYALKNRKSRQITHDTAAKIAWERRVQLETAEGIKAIDELTRNRKDSRFSDPLKELSVEEAVFISEFREGLRKGKASHSISLTPRKSPSRSPGHAGAGSVDLTALSGIDIAGPADMADPRPVSASSGPGPASPTSRLGGETTPRTSSTAQTQIGLKIKVHLADPENSGPEATPVATARTPRKLTIGKTHRQQAPSPQPSPRSGSGSFNITANPSNNPPTDVSLPGQVSDSKGTTVPNHRKNSRG